MKLQMIISELHWPLDNKLISLILDFTIIERRSLEPTILIKAQSKQFDISDLIYKYNRGLRKITPDKFINIHVYSLLIRCAILLVSKLGDNLVLLDQRYESKSLSAKNDLVFFTDNGAFRWEIEHIDKFSFRILGQIEVEAPVEYRLGDS